MVPHNEKFCVKISQTRSLINKKFNKTKSRVFLVLTVLPSKGYVERNYVPTGNSKFIK